MKRLLLLLPLAFVLNCGNDDPPGTDDQDTHDTSGDDPSDPDDPDDPDDQPDDPNACFDNPTTHVEIINACTDAESIIKTPVLPRLNADGTLPELPD
jgi:hypothetical protein